MVIRLAYERGNLTKESLNYFQNWALQYFYYMNRRTQLEDIDYQLERQCFNLNPEWWKKIYRDQVLGEASANDGGIPLTEDDLDDLDRFMEEQERSYRAQTPTEKIDGVIYGTQRMSAGEIDWRETYKQATPLNWGPWQ